MQVSEHQTINSFVESVHYNSIVSFTQSLAKPSSKHSLFTTSDHNKHPKLYIKCSLNISFIIIIILQTSHLHPRTYKIPTLRQKSLTILSNTSIMFASISTTSACVDMVSTLPSTPVDGSKCGYCGKNHGGSANDCQCNDR